MDDSPVLDENTDFFFSAALENFLLPQGSSPQTGEPLMLNQIQRQPGTLLNPTLPSSSRSPNVQTNQAVQQSQLGVMQSSFPSPSSRGPGQQIGQECPQFENPQFAGVNATMPPLVSSVLQELLSMMKTPSLPSTSSGSNLQFEQEFFEAIQAKTAMHHPIVTLSAGAMQATLQPLISQMFAEAVQKTIQPLISQMEGLVEEMRKMVHSSGQRSLPNQVELPARRDQQLRFEGSFPDELHTHTNIQEEGARLKVKLCDSSGIIVQSCAKVKLAVLDGDFDVRPGADWTKEDFEKNMVSPRKDRGPLLKGKYELCLKEGAADITDIVFTDNSSSMRNGTFRLGAQLVNEEAKEAVTEKAFKVKERRIRKSHGGPSPLDDNTCQLKNVGEKTAKKLAAEKIHTVRDFLQLYYTNRKKLQEITGISDSKLSAAVKCTEKWQFTEQGYIYSDDTTGVSLVLDCLFKIIRVTFKDQATQAYDILDNCQKDKVNKLRAHAYTKRKELPRICLETSPIPQPSDVQPVIIPCTNGTVEVEGAKVMDNHSYVPVRLDDWDALLKNDSTGSFDFNGWSAGSILMSEERTELYASNSSASQGTVNLGTRRYSVNWFRIRAAVKFKAAFKGSVKQGSKATKRPRLD